MAHVGPKTKTLLSKSFAYCNSNRRIIQNSLMLKGKKKRTTGRWSSAGIIMPCI